MSSTIGTPHLAIERIHVKGLRSIALLDLPEEGMGWNGQFPAVAMLGGGNGSGKTTLLRLIAQTGRLLVNAPAHQPEDVWAEECRIDFSFGDGSEPPREMRFLVGTKAFIEANESEHCFGYTVTGARPRSIHRGAVVDIRATLRVPDRFAESRFPRIVLFPSDHRDLVVPRVKYRAPGKLDDDAGFVASWERPGDQQWSGSTLELLFSARWADLNADKEGHPEEAHNFERFTRAFSVLTDNRKKLNWTPKGDLVVELSEGTSHGVDELSSGERQALLLLAELRRLWRPGSLVLIDELELHLHDAWQGRLLEVVTAMQKELGGQVFITTQSHALFEMAPLGTRALLGRSRLR